MNKTIGLEPKYPTIHDGIPAVLMIVSFFIGRRPTLIAFKSGPRHSSVTFIYQIVSILSNLRN